MAPRWSLILLSVLTSVAVITFGAPGCMAGPSAPPDDRERVTIGTEQFRLEVAADEASRTAGLMFRKELPADGGMIFIFPGAAPRSFWMKNCEMDIDLIFLDPRGRVTAVHRMTRQPPRGENETEAEYDRRMSRTSSSSVLSAQFAIELAPGSLDRLQVRVDDRIDLDLARLKAMAK